MQLMTFTIQLESAFTNELSPETLMKLLSEALTFNGVTQFTLAYGTEPIILEDNSEVTVALEEPDELLNESWYEDYSDFEEDHSFEDDDDEQIPY